MMNPFSNPIFITYRRLAHRAGVLFFVLSIVAASAVLLFIQLTNFRATGHTPFDHWYYHGYLIAQTAFTYFAWGGMVAAKIGAERKDGLFETNWLTPMPPDRVVMGYLLGPAVGMLYTFLVFSAFGLAICLLADLPILYWMQTQSLSFAAVLLGGLTGLVGGLVAKKAKAGGAGTVALFFPTLFTSAAGAWSLLVFILPVLLTIQIVAEPLGIDFARDWHNQPNLFGLNVPTLIMTILGYSGAVAWLWIIARRKLLHFDQPALTTGMALLLFGSVLLPQHGLLWHLAQGRFPSVAPRDAPEAFAVLHAATLIIGMSILKHRALQADRVRIAVLAGQPATLSTLFFSGGVWFAMRLAIIAIACLLTQCYDALVGGSGWLLLPALNIFLAFTLYALVLESAAARFGGWGPASGYLASFLLYFAPLMFLFFGSEYRQVAQYSPLAPGVVATLNPTHDMTTPWIATGIHLALTATAAALWCAGWNRCRNTVPTPRAGGEA